MIAKLSGRLDMTGDGEAVIDVGGVGYLVFCSARTLSQLGTVGDVVTLVTETHVREDHIHLYGFVNAVERDWFRLLQSVQGVGARMALGVLSILAPDELAIAIGAQDKAAVQRVSGVGAKLATRIVTELRDKVPALGTGQVIQGDFGADEGGSLSDAVSALVNLGYRPAEASTAVSAAARDLGNDSEVGDLIRLGLKELAR
jgi:Holliday junction DNA helicase RuvA